MERLKIRNQIIPGDIVDELCKRVDIVDRQNAVLVPSSSKRAEIIVEWTIT